MALQIMANTWAARRLPAQIIPAPSTHASPLPGSQQSGVLAGAQQSKLLDQVRAAIRIRHYSLRTEDTYLHWIKRFLLFHGKRHPAQMGEQEISQFLSALAVKHQVSASTQNPRSCSSTATC